jgi:hypothetical protein|tara:strand:- start:58 stop:444 length:387 start_codon:yes stop_codon:yes gene_type:complete
MIERKIFATYAIDGLYNGFYPTDIWDIDKIPTENRIEITNDEWQQALQHRCKVVDGVHTLAPFTPTEQSKIDLLTVRLKRNNLLITSDWTQSIDSPLSSTLKSKWAEYRKKLRDITKTTPYVYPIEPI